MKEETETLELPKSSQLNLVDLEPVNPDSAFSFVVIVCLFVSDISLPGKQSDILSEVDKLIFINLRK